MERNIKTGFRYKCCAEPANWDDSWREREIVDTGIERGSFSRSLEVDGEEIIRSGDDDGSEENHEEVNSRCAMLE